MTVRDLILARLVEGARRYWRVTSTRPNRWDIGADVLELLGMTSDEAIAAVEPEVTKLGPLLRAGDRVKHRPTGETWVLATDEEAGKVFVCGWPETRADVADCDLVTKATEEERQRTLADAVESGGMRGSLAARQRSPDGFHHFEEPTP